MTDCKNCVHGTTLFVQERDRVTKITRHIPYGRIACRKPSYRGRTFLVNEKTDCGYYKKRERNPETSETKEA